jgi:hypothetical protein
MQKAPSMIVVQKQQIFEGFVLLPIRVIWICWIAAPRGIPVLGSAARVRESICAIRDIWLPEKVYIPARIVGGMRPVDIESKVD